MDTILDADLSTDGAAPQPRVIASKGRRVVALLWDSLLIMFPFFLQEVLHIDLLFPDMVFLAVATVYRPYMEYTFGATFGKQWMKIEVVNTAYKKASLKAILLRNILSIVAGVTSIGLILVHVQMSTYLDAGVGLVAIADAVVMFSDAQARSLHDRIAGTLVVEMKSTAA